MITTALALIEPVSSQRSGEIKAKAGLAPDCFVPRNDIKTNAYYLSTARHN